MESQGLSQSCLKASKPPQPCLEDSEDPEHWWWRFEPMLSTFCTECRFYLILRMEVAIDEIMVHFFGQSSDTFKMPNKPIKQGYKIFALVDDGYI
jgi:hypothetical protein